MKITVIGTGYVGLTTGIGLADFGCEVCCVDIVQKKIEMLEKGSMPFYEPGMREVLTKNIKNGHLSFSVNLEDNIKHADVIFIAVGTPQTENGDADLSFVYDVVDQIGNTITGYTIVVVKSTVPVGTNEKIKDLIWNRIKDRNLPSNVSVEFDVVSNPEFLREGRALYDFMHPDRVVVGTDNERPVETMKNIYRPLYLNRTPFVFTDLKTAEIIKYSSNCFLAAKVAFINEMARFCDSVGANIKDVSFAMGKDGRIGSKFLHPGPGYGGSCFPKDTAAIVHMASINNTDTSIIKAVIESNRIQKEYCARKIIDAMAEAKNPMIAILGVAFKSETDDMREAPSISIINELLQQGIKVKIYDPQAMANAEKIWGDRLIYCEDEYSVCLDCQGVAILTEWNQFRNLNLSKMHDLMKADLFFDFRNIYEPEEVIGSGFRYIGVGTSRGTGHGSV